MRAQCPPSFRGPYPTPITPSAPPGPCPTESLGLSLCSIFGTPPPPPRSTPLEGRKQEDPPKKDPTGPCFLPPPVNILNCAAWLRPSPADLHGNRAAVQVQVRIQVHPVPKGGFSLSPHSSPGWGGETQHSTGGPGGGGGESRGPQSSAPSSSVWGAPGGSSGSGVCPPGWAPGPSSPCT